MTRLGKFTTGLALSTMVLVSALSVVELKHRSRLLMSDLETLEAEQSRLTSERAQLELEESAWATHGRVEQVAQDRLDMSEPDVYSIVVVQP